MGESASQIVGQVGGVSAGVISAAAGPATAAALGISASIAIPLVGAVFAGVLAGVEAILNSGCGQSCIVTSQWANQAEPILRQNIDTYFKLPVRTVSDQQSALRMFDAIWNGLVQRCSQPGLSTAGQNCIADRQNGACKWKATANSPWPGGPAQGTCWNWFNAYRDPIANDAGVQPDPVTSSVSSDIAPIFGGGSSSGGSNLIPALVIAALVGLAVSL